LVPLACGDFARIVEGKRKRFRAYSHRELWKFRLQAVRPLGQLVALIQQRIGHVYRRQRPTPLPSRTAESPGRLTGLGSRARFSFPTRR
jgi:hypothetical protein